jgi:uncharacterized protein
MKNPFAYSNYVSGRSFCNRTKELAELLTYINASQNVLLYSHRRHGKSSLIQKIFKKIESDKRNISTIHVDLYGTVSEKDFIIRVFQELNQLESNFDKLFKNIGKSIKNFRVNVSLDPTTGTSSITPTFKGIEENVMLEGLMDILLQYSNKRKLVVALDEFQEVSEYSEEGFEKRLRSYIQKHENICYIFSGSRQHLITEMFNLKSQAFYKLADSFPLKKIETNEYLSWIKELFKGHRIAISDEQITGVINRFENHPMYIQNFLFHLWEIKGVKKLTTETIENLENTLIDKKSIEYSTLWDNLTINQKKTLKLIILNNGNDLYSADSLKSVDIKTGSVVSKTIVSLIKKEIIVKNGSYNIQDIMLKKWLFKTLSLQY